MEKTQSLFRICILSTLTGYLLFSCSNPKGSSKVPLINGDTIVFKELLVNAYEWHETKGLDYFLIENDSIILGIDPIKLDSTLNELKKTNFFTEDFLDNYKKIGQKIDFKIKNDTSKYLVGFINFPFQDYDTWTNSQMGFQKENMKITYLSILDGIATLKWVWTSYPNDNYTVRFKQLNDKWKITYLQGCDLNLY